MNPSRRRSEGAVPDRAEGYRLLDRSTDAVFTVDADWEITFWNETMAERTGLSAADVVGERLCELGYPVPEELAAAYREAMASGEPVELEQYVPDPFDYWVEVRAFPHGDGLAVFSRDVTETVERARELERQQYLLEEIQEIADIGVWEYDVAADELWWSDGVYHIHGMDPESDDSPTVGEAIERYHPEDRPRVESAIERTVTDGEAFSLELRLANPDGGVRDVRSRAEAVTEDGETVLVRGTIQDITAVKRTERNLRQQNERLDDFVDLVAHDLRNPLSVASAFTDLAVETDSVEELDRVRAALDRMNGLLDDMLATARAGQALTETAPVDVAGLARSAWANVDTGDAELRVETGVGQVQGEYGRLLRLFENLVRNSVEHGGPGVTVTVGPLPEDAGFYVEDDGPGIPPADRERVFERGYSTNDEGTGFGLAIVADVVAVHGWTIDLTESAAGGARFEVTVSADTN